MLPKQPLRSPECRLARPLLVAVAKDNYLQPKHPFADDTHLPCIAAPEYGQDITFGYHRMAPKRQSVGSTPDQLRPKMRRLLSIFAGDDETGMSDRLFSLFLQDTCREVAYFEDEDLNRSAAIHPNIEFFCGAALSAPNSQFNTPGKIRIHQALKNAEWNISKIKPVTDLGVPAFNLGNKYLSTEDFNNGLGVMVNGVQYVYVVATHYQYLPEEQKYRIGLKYLFYDVFGLDDDDLNEYGVLPGTFVSIESQVGVTAWWQLQHQHGYAPLVTRIVVEKSYEVPAV